MTLLEVLGALTVLALALTAATDMVRVEATALRNDGLLQQATEIANERAEQALVHQAGVTQVSTPRGTFTVQFNALPGTSNMEIVVSQGAVTEELELVEGP